MGRRSYKNGKIKFSGQTNPFNFINVKNNRRSNSSAKLKDIIKMNKSLSQKSNVYIDRRNTCPTFHFGDHVTERFMKEGHYKGKKRCFNLNEEEQLFSSAIPQQNANDFDECYKNDYSETISNNKRQKLERKAEKDVYKNVLQKVNDSWKNIQYLCSKNKSAPVCSSKTKDSYDITKSELQFEQKSVVRESSTKEIQPLKVLFDIKNLSLDTIVENATRIDFINDIVRDLHFIATRHDLDTAHKFREILGEEYDIFSYFKKQNLKRNFPRCQTVCLLNIVCKIYTTTEIRHPVVTAALTFMCDILGSEFYNSYDNILTRLLISEIAINCVSQSKRFLPEALQFLKTVLQLALPEETSNKKNTFRKHFDLVISQKVLYEEIPALQLYPKDKNLTLESKKVGIIFSIANQVSCFATLYKDYQLFKVIFEPLLSIFSQLPIHLYPAEMEALIKRLIDFLDRETPPLRHLTFQSVKPKPFRMFEPAFECKYEPLEELIYSNAITKHKNCSIQQKIRKEERCLLRQIRKVSRAAASVKLEDKLKSDEERKIKTTQIYSSLAAQEGEFKKMIKKK